MDFPGRPILIQLVPEYPDSLVDGPGQPREGGAVPLQGEPHELGAGVVQELFQN